MNPKISFPVVSTELNSSIFDCLQIMKSDFIKHVVITQNEHPVGVVSEGDIMSYLVNPNLSNALKEIPVNHVMKTNVVTIDETQDNFMVQCAKRMDVFKTGSVVVVDSENKVKGIVTKSDVTEKYAENYQEKRKISEYMNCRVFTCRANDSLEFILNTMSKYAISRIVITNSDGMPTGIITTNNLLVHCDYFTESKTRSKDFMITINRSNATANDLMEKELVVLKPEDDLAQAAKKMSVNKINGIPIVEKDQVAGIVTTTNITKAFSEIELHAEFLKNYKKTY